MSPIDVKNLSHSFALVLLEAATFCGALPAILCFLVPWIQQMFASSHGFSRCSDNFQNGNSACSQLTAFLWQLSRCKFEHSSKRKGQQVCQKMKNFLGNSKSKFKSKLLTQQTFWTDASFWLEHKHQTCCFECAFVENNCAL